MLRLQSVLIFSIAAAVTLAQKATAEDFAIENLAAAEFNQQSIAGLKPKTIYFTDTSMPFSEWTKSARAEAEFLTLYPGYTEPTVTVLKHGTQERRLEKLTVFIAKSRMIADRAPGDIHLDKFIQLKTVQALDPEVQHRQIDVNQLMSNSVAKPPVSNFAWCNASEQYITRPAREVELSHTQPKGGEWCVEKDRSICVESCYLFGKLWFKGVYAVNTLLDEDEQKDYGIGTQSEIRIFNNDEEFRRNGRLSALTKLNTPVRGVLEQSLFYFNQVMQYGKVIAVFQDHPTDPSKTVVSSFFVIGIKTRTYNSANGIVQEVLLGRSALNTSTGITAGLPVFTQNMAKSIARML